MYSFVSRSLPAQPYEKRKFGCVVRRDFYVTPHPPKFLSCLMQSEHLMVELCHFF